MRSGTEEASYISYTNSNREDPVEYRYKGADRLSKLKELKKKWNPRGAFTQEFLPVGSRIKPYILLIVACNANKTHSPKTGIWNQYDYACPE